MRVKLLRTSLLLFVIAVMAQNTTAQTILEDDVPFTIQKWYFSKYPGANEVNWMKTKSESGEDLIQADFEYEDQHVMAVYNLKGKQVYENIEYKKSNSPLPIMDHAASNYEKFKIVGIHKHTNFFYGAQKTSTTNYELIVKVNKEVRTVWFNESLNRQDQFDVSNLAIK